MGFLSQFPAATVQPSLSAQSEGCSGSALPKPYECRFCCSLLNCSSTFQQQDNVGSNDDRASLEKTSEAIRGAFARGDVTTILAYHHPDVIKALSYEKYINGRDALEADLVETLQRFNLEWKQNRVESISNST